jgi:hypothetical protein
MKKTIVRSLVLFGLLVLVGSVGPGCTTCIQVPGFIGWINLCQ